jgi:hypothetical protein
MNKGVYDLGERVVSGGIPGSIKLNRPPTPAGTAYPIKPNPLFKVCEA